jgi:hypothetical protein
MNPFQACKDEFRTILKPLGYREQGKNWYSQNEIGVIKTISYNVRSVTKDDFLFGVNYSINFKGVHELVYNRPFDLKKNLEIGLIKSSLNLLRQKNSFEYLPNTPINSLLHYTRHRITDEAVPFLSKFETGEHIALFLEENLSKFIKSDSLLVLSLSALHVVLGNKNRGIELTREVLRETRVPFVFAEDFLDRIS